MKGLTVLVQYSSKGKWRSNADGHIVFLPVPLYESYCGYRTVINCPMGQEDVDWINWKDL